MSGNIITKLKNIRKESQKQVSLWQRLYKSKPFGKVAKYNYQWMIDDISDDIVCKLCKSIGISANFLTLDKFLRTTNDRVKPSQLQRLAKAAKRKSKLVDLLDISSFKNSEDLRLVRFV